jgi:hypothetical protein
MSDYKESPITGVTWTRACRVVLDNPQGGVPSCMFVEEEATRIGTNKVFTQPVANLSAAMDPANPLHLEIYNKVNELYVLLREARDAEEVTNGGA